MIPWIREHLMDRNKLMKFVRWLFLLLCFAAVPFFFSFDARGIDTEPRIHIDIPVILKRANVVFNMDHIAFDGDMPVGIKYMRLLANRFKETGTHGQIIGIFHSDAAYMTLNDRAYNAYRKVSTGNPYKDLLAELMKQGVQIEECAVSMKAHGWRNEDLLPGVKVNTGAVGRIIQLVQEGYVQIEP